MQDGLKLANRLILCVDDDQDNLTLVTRVLEYEGHRIETALSGEEALEKLKSTAPDLVLLDIDMPGLSGLETLKRLRERDEYVSVIFVSALGTSEDVIAGLDAGADDYVCKPFDPMVLMARVRAQLRIKDLNDNLASANSRLQQLVDIDDLTGLYNMRSIYQRLDSELNRARRFHRSVGVMMMDMDDFKLVNDGHDHLFGSFVLSEIGKLILANIRSTDFAARYGGDEFLIALPESSLEGAARFADRLRHLIEEHLFTNNVSKMKLTASLGLAVVEPALFNIDARGLVRFADHALYQAKHAGKNCVRFYDAHQSRFKKTS